MVLAGHSDASHLSESKSCSRISGNFFLSNKSINPLNNGDVLTTAQIIKAVMSSAAEADLGTLYINCCKAIPTRHTLIAMRHLQPTTKIQIDNTMALGFFYNTIAPWRTKAMDMRLHWMRCQKAQQRFRYYWQPGPTNNGDYVTKHHAAVQNRAI